jgi:hypothetical protein
MRCPGQSGRGKASDASNLVGIGRCAGNRARPLTRSHLAAPSPARGRGRTRSSSARDSFSSRKGRGLRRSSGRACGSYRLQKSTSGVWRRRRTGDEPVAASRLAGLLSKAGERTSEAGSRRQSLETGGGLRAAKAERGIRRWKAPGASRPGLIVDAIGSGRGSASSSGFGWKGSCPRVSEVGQAPRLTEENAVAGVASLGGLARSAARQGPSGARRERLERAQIACRCPTEVRCAPSSALRPERRVPKPHEGDGNRWIRWCS